MEATRHWRGVGLGLLGLMLAAGMIISTSIAAGALKRTKLADETISVKGYAQKPIRADLAVWGGVFARRAPRMADAYAQLKADLAAVLDFLGKSGFPKTAIEIAPVRSTALNAKNEKGGDTNQIEMYVLTQGVTVRSTDIDLVASVSRSSAALIEAGVVFESGSPQYLYTKLNDLKVQILAEAARDAYERAKQLASNSGGSVGSLRTARQGVFQITPLYSTEVSDYGINDTSSIEKSVKAVVTMEYAIR